MNVNDARFDLLLGRADWGRCLDGDGEDARTVASWWDGAVTSPPVELPRELPAWDARRAELSLQPLAIELPDTPGETRLALDARRAAAADRHGNVYRVGSDRRSLSVHSAGSRRESTFWPAEPSDCAEERARARLDFAPHAGDGGDAAESYLALAVTADDYLVVAFARGDARGFLSFDLVAGGPPVRTRWPDAVAREFTPFDMAARRGGGVWVLDRAARLLWELDCRLAVVSVAQPSVTLDAAEPDDFQPLSGAPRDRPSVTFPGGIELAGSPAWVVDPIAVEALGDGVVLLLDRDEGAARSRVVRLRRGGDWWRADASRWLDELPGGGLAHDFVHATARVYGREEPAAYLFIVTSSGNQARAYEVLDAPDAFVLRGAAELFPLRRFGGRALVAVRGAAHYDSGVGAVVWTPVVHQPRARFEQEAELVTPVFDSRELGTTWDRVLLDACVPPDTAVEVESRAGDERADLADGAGSPGVEAPQVVGAWLPEPSPHLRATGPELPWLRAEAARATRREDGVGTWELLLQRARGRYLQLRLRLRSDGGAATPRVRALRVWSPRFSYPQRFLPAAYREDVASGSLLERWLANLESTLTHVEDRVAHVQALFDARVAPAETLAWLAEWFDVAYDPAWDERRRRLFVRHAMDLFRWRGTVHGLRAALELAFDECFDASSFEPPADGAADERLQRIRIVEAYQTRLVGAVVAGDPGAAGADAAGAAGAAVVVGPREVRRETLWTPSEGNAGLVDRYHEAVLGREATPAEQLVPFSLVAPPGDAGERWRAFVQAALGFVPSIGADERARWQRYLAARYVTAAEIPTTGEEPFGDFGDVPLPRDWPQAPAVAEHWRAFSALGDGAWTRSRWQDFLARRYRHVERLDRAYGTAWPGFEVVAVPDVLPGTEPAQADWLQFERQVLAMHRTAHRFSVLLPVAEVTADPYALDARLGLAQRIVELEKPAHTVFDVRFFWAFFRVGEARLGTDTLLGAGSRAPELIPAAVLGRAYVGSGFVGGAERHHGGDRLTIAC
jgi:phage tail-like protein